jgi:hypothetical protein
VSRPGITAYVACAAHKGEKDQRRAHLATSAAR